MLKGNISDEDFMIHVLNNLPEKYDVILNRLQNCLMENRDNALTIDIIRKKINRLYKKINNKNEEKREKEKALGA